MKTKFITALAVLGSFLLPIAGFAQKKPHIIVVTHGQVSDSFWLVVKNGVEQAAKDTGSEVEYRAPEKFDMVAMAQLIDAAVASKPDGLVVSIPDADALGKSIEAAVKAGIPVISMNSGSDVSKKFGCLMHVGQEEYIAGKGAGERMKAEGVKKAVCVNQEVGNAGLDARAKGFKDGLAAMWKSLRWAWISLRRGTHSPAIYKKIRILREFWRSDQLAPNQSCKLSNRLGKPVRYISGRLIFHRRFCRQLRKSRWNLRSINSNSCRVICQW